MILFIIELLMSSYRNPVQCLHDAHAHAKELGECSSSVGICSAAWPRKPRNMLLYYICMRCEGKRTAPSPSTPEVPSYTNSSWLAWGFWFQPKTYKTYSRFWVQTGCGSGMGMDPGVDSGPVMGMGSGIEPGQVRSQGRCQIRTREPGMASSDALGLAWHQDQFGIRCLLRHGHKHELRHGLRHGLRFRHRYELGLLQGHGQGHGLGRKHHIFLSHWRELRSGSLLLNH